MAFDSGSLVESLASEADADAEVVKRVLDRLGLESVLEAAERSGSSERISVGDLKLAARVGKNTIHV